MFLQQFTYMCMTLSIKVSLMKGEVYWALSEQLPKCIGAQWVTLTLSPRLLYQEAKCIESGVNNSQSVLLME